jgi:WD40 repeat protein
MDVIKFDVSTSRVNSCAFDGDSAVYFGFSDSSLRLFDLQSPISAKTPSARQIVPKERSPVLQLDFNHQKRWLLVVTASCSVQIFNADLFSLKPLYETAKGDPYVKQKGTTNGHQGNITIARFISDSQILSCGEDGTARIFDLINGERVGMDKHIKNSHVFRCINSKNLETSQLKCTFSEISPDKSTIIVGCTDGSVQIFKYSNTNNGGRPIFVHRRREECTAVSCAISSSSKFLFGYSDGVIEYWSDIPKSTSEHKTWKFNLEISSICVGSIKANEELVFVAGADNIEMNLFSFSLLDSSVESPNLTSYDLPVTSKNSCTIKNIIFDNRTRQCLVLTSTGQVFVIYNKEMSRGGLLETLNYEKVKGIVEVKTGSMFRADVVSYDDLIASGKWKETRSGNAARPVIDEDDKKRVERLKQMQAADLYKAKDINQIIKHRRNAGNEGSQSQDNQSLALIDDSKLGGTARKLAMVENMLKTRNFCPRCGLKLCTCAVNDSKRSRNF